MAIPVNRLYPKQMNGPVISANGEAVNAEFADVEAVENYLYELSISTAQETELENIGRIIGYPRPLVPEGFNNENVLILGSLPLEQDFDIGLATVGETLGGQLSTVTLSETDFMSLGTYRKFLTSVAILKRYGITLKSVDKIASVLSNQYTISFNEDNDIVIQYTENIGFKNLWILSKLFYRIATAPQVLIQSAEE